MPEFEELVEFIAAEKWEGKREDYVWKQGPMGAGYYYSDDPDAEDEPETEPEPEPEPEPEAAARKWWVQRRVGWVWGRGRGAGLRVLSVAVGSIRSFVRREQLTDDDLPRDPRGFVMPRSGVKEEQEREKAGIVFTPFEDVRSCPPLSRLLPSPAPAPRPRPSLTTCIDVTMWLRRG